MNLVIREYVDEEGVSPFGRWFGKLDPVAAARIATALYRLENGNTSNVKALGGGISEYKIHFGPGYRIYFGMDSQTLVVLLAGGTKKRQNRDVETARIHWRRYLQLKAQEEDHGPDS